MTLRIPLPCRRCGWMPWNCTDIPAHLRPAPPPANEPAPRKKAPRKTWGPVTRSRR